MKNLSVSGGRSQCLKLTPPISVRHHLSPLTSSKSKANTGVEEDKLVRTGSNGVDDKPNNEGADKTNTQVEEDKPAKVIFQKKNELKTEIFM